MTKKMNRTIEYWQQCLERVEENDKEDIFSRLLILGQIRKLQRKEGNDDKE